jgi:hypothetical protein
MRKRKPPQQPDKFSGAGADKTWSPSSTSDNLSSSYSNNSNFSSFIREQVEGYCNEANLHFMGALNSLKAIDAPRLSKPIEDVQEETSRKLQLKKKQFLNDLTAMLLTDPDIFKYKPSKNQWRDKSDSISSNSPQLSDPSLDITSVIEWGFNDDKGNFVPFDNRTSNMIEREYIKDKKGSVRLNNGFLGSVPQGYLLDFETMKQMKVDNGAERTVQRKYNWIKLDEHKKKMTELEEKVKKLEQTIQTLQPQPQSQPQSQPQLQSQSQPQLQSLSPPLLQSQSQPPQQPPQQPPLHQVLKNSKPGSKKKTVIYDS